MIQDIHTDVGGVGIADHENLVAADSDAAVGKNPRRGRADLRRIAIAPTTITPVENDEIISKAVHFQKFRHGQPIRQIPANEKRCAARA